MNALADSFEREVGAVLNGARSAADGARGLVRCHEPDGG